MMDKSAIQAMLAEALDKGDTSKADKLPMSFERIDRIGIWFSCALFGDTIYI